jgi:hypothetical protein
MADWNHKNAGVLLDALRHHISGAKNQHGELLISVAEQVRDAENRQRINATSLDQFRSSVCELCREHQMYECDVPVGWSHSCALIHSNT